MITDQRELNMERDIMRRVRFIYAIRVFKNGETLKGIVFGLSTVVVLSITHVTNVVQNMAVLESWLSYPEYILGAYLHTSLVVQSVVVLAFAAGMWLVVDITRNFNVFHLRLRRI